MAAYVEQHLVDLCAELINEGNAAVGHAVAANMSASSMIQLGEETPGGTRYEQR